MSSLAEQALEHARLRMAGQPKKRPTSVVPKVSTPRSTAISTGIVVSGPINQFMVQEGRAWAIDMVDSMRASPVKEVIERLTGAAAGRPGSYAHGIQSVIDVLTGANHANEA